MVNYCSVCNRPVAGHSKFGCLPGPGNCTLTPLPPSSRSSSSSEGVTPSTSTVTSTPLAIPVTSSSTDVSTVLTVTSQSQQIPASPDMSQDPGVVPSSSNALSNAEMATVLASQNDILEARIKETEAMRTIHNLQAKQLQLKKRLQELEAAHNQPQPLSAQSHPPTNPVVSQGVPPSSSVTWSVTNPFAPPPQSSTVSAASFGAASAMFGGLPSSLVSATQSQHSNMTSFGISSGIPASSYPFNPPTRSAPNPLGQSQCSNFTTSLPNLHNFTTNTLPPHQASSTRGPLFPAQSVPNMAASNENPFLSAEDIFNLNPVAKALLGLQNESKEESVSLGKYIPELFALKYGTINEIRSKMTYSEFIAMYTRMIMYMLRDDPHLVPDRLVFLYNISKKAAKFRWPDVRECYGVAMHELKIKRRKWADPWDELTEDLEKSQANTRPAGNRPISARSAGVKMVSPLDPDRPLCADYNDRVCHRSVCKFNHECARCGDKHPRRICNVHADTRPYPSASHHSQAPAT